MNISLIRFKCLMFKHILYQVTLPNLKRKIKFSILLLIYILSFSLLFISSLFLFESFFTSSSIYSYDYFTIFCFSITYFKSLLITCHTTVARIADLLPVASRGAALWSIGTFEYLIRVRSYRRTPFS